MEIASLFQSEKSLAQILVDRDDMILSLSRDMIAMAQQNEALKQENASLKTQLESACSKAENLSSWSPIAK